MSARSPGWVLHKKHVKDMLHAACLAACKMIALDGAGLTQQHCVPSPSTVRSNPSLPGCFPPAALQKENGWVPHAPGRVRQRRCCHGPLRPYAGRRDPCGHGLVPQQIVDGIKEGVAEAKQRPACGSRGTKPQHARRMWLVGGQDAERTCGSKQGHCEEDWAARQSKPPGRRFRRSHAVRSSTGE